ncbi:MAG: hypothetical protein E6713_07630 [Sporomusaceae bacterium]|nr:hypothetical protein [Sporomusaceae bacterium]
MMILKSFFYTIIITLICASFVQIQTCQASAREDVLLVVVDSSKEAYGSQLKKEVNQQLETHLSLQGSTEQKIETMIQEFGVNEFSNVEKPELAELTKKMGVHKAVIVEILPAMIEYNQIASFQKIQADATLRIRLYDADKEQYIFMGNISGKGSNKTFLPFTSIGTKPAVLEAVQKAALVATEKISGALHQAM